MTRFLLYGGKGGVGKTTVAAATGHRLATAGHETLVVSTDPAHSLADAVETDVGGDPTEIKSGLWGVEIDPQTGIDRYRSLFEALASEFADAGIRMDEDEIADLFTTGVMPGSDELAAIEGMATYIESDRWDRVVFDTAPTGHTLRLLDLPSVMDRGVATAMDLRDQVRRKVNTARTMMFGPMANRRDDGPDDFTAMRERMERVGMVLRDPEQTAFRVVTIPETMAVRETERLVGKLREFEVPVTTLVVNKVIEDAGDCQRCQGKQAVQEEAIAQLRESLPDLDVWTIPDQSGEVTGLSALERVAGSLSAVE
ncbi:arsenic ABC transporter ATPase [Haloarcula hispanica N601]|uniref:Arsenic ABC transporter ATPase n=3 Tax=Haloarcula hispanica TaxID=51589 RepID=V5TJV8_HALHI|nr:MULTISPECIES: ArsA family ATPase [Haloarcula]AEM56459.1 transport ATPase (substrate arsenite) [Haloarcula hispanica ATCC 33960]AHB65272.1 arsenic ABC transporter ATPase [Haloarcula hispanica N601]KAA9407766.1 arsenic-transporting ATPase [Haloarcula sp. CBA1131]MCJ0618248.1 ArsA family ATPase [Haloarcula hispanica]RYJ08858.1 arsenic-transporting ATPase [Haloarcula hispanica]